MFIVYKADANGTPHGEQWFFKTKAAAERNAAERMSNRLPYDHDVYLVRAA